jgi:hypothetical protein
MGTGNRIRKTGGAYVVGIIIFIMHNLMGINRRMGGMVWIMDLDLF